MTIEEFHKARYDIITGMEKIIENANIIFPEKGQLSPSCMMLKLALMDIKKILGYKKSERNE